MKPEIKGIDSPDVDDIEAPAFESLEDVYLLIQIYIGPPSSEGYEMFTVVVCTAEALKAEYNRQTPRYLRNHLLVETYDYDAVVNHIQKTCNRVVEDTWSEVAEKLNRYFRWELEDYVE